MNNRLLIVGVCLVLLASACTKSTSITPSTDIIDTSTATLKYHGTFQNGPYGTVSGTAAVYQTGSKLQLKLSNFNTTNGPDLKVYLSKEIQPVSFISLGDLKSTSGNQVYDIIRNPDFTQYKYALIHCEQYNHLFGVAQLMMR